MNKLLILTLTASTLCGQTQRTTGQFINSQVPVAHNGSFAIVASSMGGSFTSNTTAAWTLVQCPSTGVKAGDYVTVANTGAFGSGAVLTVTATVSTFYGSLTSGLVLTLIAGQAATVTCDGSGLWLVNLPSVGGGGGGGSTTLQIEGTPTGTFDTENIVAGFGILPGPSLVGSTFALNPAIDSAKIPSKANLQSATNPMICTSASSSGTAYTATCAFPLGAYATKQTLFWFADVANTSTTPTLNIDTLGAKTLVKQNGSALGVSDIGAGVYRIWYDGSNFHVSEIGSGGGGGGGTATGGLFASRGAPAAAGTVYFSSDVPIQSWSDGAVWHNQFRGQPVNLPSDTSFSSPSGFASATVTTNGVMNFKMAAVSVTFPTCNIAGREIATAGLGGTWTVYAAFDWTDSGVINNGGTPGTAYYSPGHMIYVRDSTNKMIAVEGHALWPELAEKGYNIDLDHIDSPTGNDVSDIQHANQAVGYSPNYLYMRYDGTNFRYGWCTFVNHFVTGGTEAYNGSNCREAGSEAANAYIGAQVAVGVGFNSATTYGSTNVDMTVWDFFVTN